MKKTLFSLATLGFLMFSAIRSGAQNHEQKYLGVVLGINEANELLNAQPEGISSYYRAGIIAGIQGDRWFNSQWGIRMRDVYVQQGHNDNLNQNGTGILYGSTRTGIDNVETTSLDADLLLKKTIWGNDVIRTYAYVGPSLGIILSGKEYLNDTVSTSVGKFVGDTTFTMLYSNVLDWSVVLGLGISVKLDSGPMFFVDAGYWYGLTNIYLWNEGSVYTRDIRLTAGILFPIHLPSLLL
jgi:hypothetical protein